MRFLVEEAVVELSGEGAEQRLVAYVVAGEEGTPSARELRRYVRSKLPEHMVPASYVKVEEMPLLASGKVNRRGLGGVAGWGCRSRGW
jgi:acyl-coenzyme A synthetase/AMP-(fatty) acid ligase